MFLHLGELIPYLSLNFTMGKHAQQMIREHIRLKNKNITLLLSQIKKKKKCGRKPEHPEVNAQP